MENGLLGLVEFAEIHTDPARWEVRRKYSLGAGGMVRSLPPPEMFALMGVFIRVLANSGKVCALICSKLHA